MLRLPLGKGGWDLAMSALTVTANTTNTSLDQPPCKAPFWTIQSLSAKSIWRTAHVPAM